MASLAEIRAKLKEQESRSGGSQGPSGPNPNPIGRHTSHAQCRGVLASELWRQHGRFATTCGVGRMQLGNLVDLERRRLGARVQLPCL
mgnify:CR=1 FL=1